MSPQFKAGDAVVLKSGGPPMTIEKITPDGVATCKWFQDKELKAALFRVETLKAYDSTPAFA